jgi:nucleoside-diphosphate-sugar epimerase
MEHVFVTGGSGFIGRALVRRLVKDGNAVRVLVRSRASADVVASLGATPVRGGLTEPAGWQHEAKGSEVVFHLAAETDITADRAQHEHVTVQGTQAVVDAAREAGVPRFVHCGTEAALLAGDPLVDADETAPLRPDSPAAYSATKAIAEKIVLDASSPGFATVSIRPRFVWGPESFLIDDLAEAARAGQFTWIGGSRQNTDVTYVDNVVDGLILGWRNGRPGQAYFVTDQHRVVFREFIETMFDIYGIHTSPPDLDTDTADREVPVPARWFFGQECTLRTDKAVAELGYRPIVSHAAGLAATRDWVAARSATGEAVTAR